ncbi:MAG: RNA ligase family protein [Candidatus Woesearchaeota archaeon]
MNGYMLYKYPRTYHLPFSKKISNNDRVMEDLSYILKNTVVITEKYDGENTTLYNDYIHSRSLDYSPHWSRNLMKKFHAEISYKIPKNIRICGENLIGTHTIKYDNLPHFFLGFSAWEKDYCLPWEDTLDLFRSIGICPVKQLYYGKVTLDILNEICEKLDKNNSEGYVVRVADGFYMDEFSVKVGKFVFSNFSVSEKDWKNDKTENSWNKNII